MSVQIDSSSKYVFDCLPFFPSVGVTFKKGQKLSWKWVSNRHIKEPWRPSSNGYAMMWTEQRHRSSFAHLPQFTSGSFLSHPLISNYCRTCLVVSLGLNQVLPVVPFSHFCFCLLKRQKTTTKKEEETHFYRTSSHYSLRGGIQKTGHLFAILQNFEFLET